MVENMKYVKISQHILPGDNEILDGCASEAVVELPQQKISTLMPNFQENHASGKHK